jgi:hypothetical protein
MKEFSDAHVSYKIGGGSHSFSFMQSLNAKLMAGFEMFYIVKLTLNFINYLYSPIRKKCTCVWELTLIMISIVSMLNIYPLQEKKP